jgi:Domain of unknown function (DUF5010)/DUF5010 C-terminal domain/Fascin domain
MRRSAHARPLRVLLALLAPGAAACSVFAPSYDEFASGPGSGAAGASAAAAVSGSSASPQGGGGAAGQASAGFAGYDAAAGEGGAAGGIDETPDPPAVQGQAVPPGSVALQPVVDSGRPSFPALLRYDVDEATAAAASQPPLYQPYDSTAPAFWDEVVAELLQARVAEVALPSRGAFNLTTSDLTGPGNENPRRLSAWLAAVARANAGNLFQTYCFVDTPYLQQVSNSVHGTPSSAPFDLSLSSDWTSVVWARVIQPWFDTIPATHLYEPTYHPLVQFGPLPSTGFANASANLSAMLTAVANSFSTAYGSTPNYVLDETWFVADASLATNPDVIGSSPWLVPTTSAYGFNGFNGRTVGTVVPGFAEPSIPRHTVDSYNVPVTTLLNGLSNTPLSTSFAVLQGFTDYADAAGFYRSDAADWSTPNEYINLVRRFGDPNTSTVRLEAEGPDRYSDTTAGNSGTAFRRSGDLDVRALTPSGWAVTDTAPGEWIEFDNVELSAGTYNFVAEYATGTGQTPGDGPRIELVLDGVKLAPVILPKTANSDAFANVLLGQQTVSHGPHTLRLRFLDGLVDLDWLFVDKLDKTGHLQVSAGTFVSASGGGGTDVNSGPTIANIWETFTFDDLNGGSLTDGDSICMQTLDGLYVAVTGGAITAAEREPGPESIFTIHVQGGGLLAAGAKVALETSDSHYLTSAGKMLDASGTSVGPAQIFTFNY